MTARERRRFLFSTGLALAIGVLVSAGYVHDLIPGAQGLQHLVNDAALFKTRPPTNTATRVALVHVDERSVAALRERYGRVFSWPRTVHAQVLRNLADVPARVVAFDVLFDAPGCAAALPPPCPDDVALAEAIEYARRGPAGGTQVVLAMLGDPPEPRRLAGDAPLTFRDAVLPVPPLAAQATALGHVHVFPDADGTVRRVPLVASIGGQDVPALALEGAARYLRRRQAVEGRGPGYLYTTARTVPTGSHYQALVNYLGRPSHVASAAPRGPVPVVSFVDVLDNAFDRDVVRDRLVFVGLTAAGFADDYWVPTSPAGQKMSGVEIHAQTAEMLIRGAFLQQQGTATTVAAIVLLSLIPGVTLARVQPVLAGAVTLGLFGAYAAVTVGYGARSEALVERSSTFTVLNTVHPALGLLVTSIAVMLYRIVFEQAEQRATRQAMGKYLSPAVMAEVLKDPERLQLGGQKREMTVLFCDIRGFTSVAEKMDPSDLVQFLNEYLTEMTAIVFQHQGVLDKYRGDGIMAFWGAPTAQPNHAEQACRTAFRMMRRLRELQRAWWERGMPVLNMGVGINTGPMTVGNVGSRMRFDYTVMGDAVNLASRLETANKTYGTSIIIGEGTLRYVRATFAVRFLDLVAVGGKTAPAAIYELLAPLDEPAAVPPPELLRTWEAAIAHYRAQRFDAAREAFRRVLAIKPDDVPARTFVERCEALAAAPPGSGWNGVYVTIQK